MPKETFRSAFTQNDLIATSTVSLVGGQFIRLGAYTVQAGELVSAGYGQSGAQDSAAGRIYAKIRDNSASPGAAIPGVLRLSIYSPQDRPIEIINEWRTETLETSATDRTLQIPFPEHDAWVSEDKKIVLEFKADATATLGKSNTVILMDVTKSVV